MKIAAAEGQRKNHTALDCCSVPSGPVLPSPSVSHLIRESSTKTPHQSYENPIPSGCDQNQLAVTSGGLAWREPLRGVPYVGCHGWHPSKEHFFLINIYKEKTQNLRIWNESHVVCLVFSREHEGDEIESDMPGF